MPLPETWSSPQLRIATKLLQRGRGHLWWQKVPRPGRVQNAGLVVRPQWGLVRLGKASLFPAKKTSQLWLGFLHHRYNSEPKIHNHRQFGPGCMKPSHAIHREDSCVTKPLYLWNDEAILRCMKVTITKHKNLC